MFDEERFKVLLSDYFDESLRGNDRATFEQMLRTTARARELFWEAAEHHALAREWALSSIGADRAALMEDDGKVVDFRTEKQKWKLAGLLTTAAAMLALAFFLPGRPDAPKKSAAEQVAEPPAASHIAMIGLSSSARWDGPDGERNKNDALGVGGLKLLSGNVRIDFYSGTRVWLRGPAEVELISENEMELKSGVLSAEVPPAAIGFKVISGDLVVTDLGTEFGVSSLEGVAEVHVFSGKVNVESPRSGKSQHLSSGQSLRTGKGKWQAASAEPKKFPDKAAIIEGLEYERETRYTEWSRKTAEFSKLPGVLVHYDFTPEGKDGKIINLVPGASEMSQGTVVGGEWSMGRWERKKALSFNGVSDRVRLAVPGTYESVTFLTWLRLDDLPGQLAAILRVEQLTPGCLRWGIDSLGRVRMGVYTEDDTFVSPNNVTPFRWDIAMSEPMMGRELGSWVHLAAVYHSRKKVIELWLNGERIARKTLRYDFPAPLGVLQIGSALTPEDKGKTGRTILGRMDEFAVVGRAFTPQEIRGHYRQGKPRDANNAADPADW